MSLGTTEFQRRAVRPMECLTTGWRLIKDDYWLFFGITFVGMLIAGAIPFGILLGPMWCGIDICLLRRHDGQRVKFGHLFEGFNYFGPSFVATLFVIVPAIIAVLIIALVYIIAMFGFVVPQANQGGPPDAAFLGSFFGVMGLYMIALTAVGTLMMAPCIFMYGLIVERQMSGPEAFWTSIKAVFANFWGVLGLLILYTLLQFAGALLCFVGAYLIMPITFAAFAVAYRQVFPLRQLAYDFADDAEPEAEAEPAPNGSRGVTGIQSQPTREPPETGITPVAPAE
jgi:hypothetical protein